MKIYNSLTRKKQEFESITPKVVNMYTCGVTVYDDCHIGHARSLYIFDAIRRYLEYKGYKVNFVRNITDIDDKIIKRANELKVNWQDLVAKYIASYNDDLKLLGIRKGILDKDKEEPRATKNIPEMIKYIEGLINKGYAYEAGGDVYFNVRKFSDYGKLSGQGIDKMLEGVRIEPGEGKKDPLDFALWKKSKENEPWWDSRWGKGRPGWHIECSVMSQKFLKTDRLDIHAGGIDLIFPHHENETAQAEALTGKPFAKYWIHHGLLTINGQKMAKSLGNFIIVKEALKKYTSEEELKKYKQEAISKNAVDMLKLCMGKVHYRSPLDFSDKSIQDSKAELKGLKAIFFIMDLYIQDCKDKKLQPQHQMDPDMFRKKICDYKTKFIEAMDDDFNTPDALGIFHKLVSYVFTHMNPLRLDLSCLEDAKKMIIEMLDIFGLSWWGFEEHINSLIKPTNKVKIESIKEERDKARKTKDFKKADQIKQELLELELKFEDGLEGTTYRPI